MPKGYEKKPVRNEFLEWLQQEKGLMTRSAQDVLSRLSRTEKLVDIENPDLTVDDIVYRLNKSKFFKELNSNIRSQLKRAIKLYKEFNKDFFEKKNPELFDQDQKDQDSN